MELMATPPVQDNVTCVPDVPGAQGAPPPPSHPRVGVAGGDNVGQPTALNGQVLQRGQVEDVHQGPGPLGRHEAHVLGPPRAEAVLLVRQGRVRRRRRRIVV